MKRLLAYFALVATLLFLATVVALLFLAPDVDPLRSGISFYALTRYGPVIGLALALVGLSGIALAIAAWQATPSFAGRIGLGLLIAWGLTSVLAGAFPLDAPGAAPTLSGTIHNMAGLNFFLVVLAVLLIEHARSRRMDPAHPRPSADGLAWLLFVAAILLFTFNGPLAPLGIGGLVQRLYWLVLALWLLFKARQVLRALGHAPVADVSAT